MNVQEEQFMLKRPNISTIDSERMRPKSKIRRTHFVEVNKAVWRYFEDCKDGGVQLNGKNLRDYALQYAGTQGCAEFRASEGWLDAFKRRHQIDFKRMMGSPVSYDTESEIRNSGSTLPAEPTLFDVVQEGWTNQILEALSANAEAADGSKMMDLANIFSLNQPSTSYQQANATTVPENQPTIDFFNGATLQEAIETQNTQNNDIMRSCALKNKNKELQCAVDTIRTFIVENDPSAISHLVKLQDLLINMEVKREGTQT